MNKRLTRSSTDRKISGVCGGIAEYLNIDSTIIRLAFILIVFAGGFGLLLYIIAALIMPMNYETYGEYKGSSYSDCENVNESKSKQSVNVTDNEKDDTPEDKADNEDNSQTKSTSFQSNNTGSIKKSGSSSAAVIGIVLITIGIICMINIFFPAFDYGAIFALLIIALGVLIIVKGGK